MLPRAYRLRRSRDFRDAFSRGRTQSLPSLRIVVRLRAGESDPTEPPRVGFVVSKKVGDAVVRNRVKRLLREACRRHVGTWRPGYDVVFVARASLRGTPLGAMDDAVRELARRADLMSEAGVRAPSEEPRCGGSSSA